MEKVRYMISDAANMVHVEAHVLRYWEEELDLSVPRNEMGHRYYTRENIMEFQRIKDLKEKGYQLKSIRMILHGGTDVEQMEVDTISKPLETRKQHSMASVPQPVEKIQKPIQTTAEDRMQQFREVMSDIVGHAIALNNEELSQNIGKEVQERIIKEMNYLERVREEAEEERFRKLDAAIRGTIRRKRKLFSSDKPKETEKKKKEKKKKEHS